jgi:hypothetical protein
MTRRVTLVGLLLLVAAPRGYPSQETAKMVVAEPKEIQDVLANPGMGWQTFHCFADEDEHLRGIPTKTAYFRFYWDGIEPEEGKVDFALFDELLAHAHRAGQRLGFRIMIASTDPNSLGAPKWLRDKGVHGWEYSYDGHGRWWTPDMDDPVVKNAHTRLLRALGERYDGHPDLDYIDIGSVGLWGEWHFSATRIIPGGERVPMPSEARRIEIVDEYRRYFPKTPKLMLIGDEPGLTYAVAHGCGWRADCFGDMGGFSPTWSHMANAYRQELAAARAGEAWKQAPVAWESCWDMRKWVDEGWDLRYIFDYGLELHGSYLNNKSAPIEEAWLPEINRFLLRMGYRLALRRVEHPGSAAAGDRMTVTADWENVGVAPPYHDFLVAFRLAGAAGQSEVLVTEQSVKGWLPGKQHQSYTLAVPRSLPAGRYTLSVGVVDPATRAPAVNLAIAGRTADGWYPVSAIEVTAAR